MSWGNGRPKEDRWENLQRSTRGPYTRWHENRDGTRRVMGGNRDEVAPPAHIGETIREARIAAGLTQEALLSMMATVKIGKNEIRQTIGRTMLAQIETGKKPLIKRNWELMKRVLPNLAGVKTVENTWNWRTDERRISLAPPPAKPKPAAKPKRRKK